MISFGCLLLFTVSMLFRNKLNDDPKVNLPSITVKVKHVKPNIPKVRSLQLLPKHLTTF